MHHYCQQTAVTPDPKSLNSNKKAAKLPLLSAVICHTRLDGQHCSVKQIRAFFSRVKKPSDDMFIFDEYERANIAWLALATFV